MAVPIRKSEVVDQEEDAISEEQVKEILYPELSLSQRIEKAESELKLLRNDVINRIAGMVKAMAAVERGHNKAAEAVSYLEKLPEKGAAELIEEYRRTSARFRSAFPSSFGLGTFYSGSLKGLKNPEDYK